jgi:hypothetical protein
LVDRNRLQALLPVLKTNTPAHYRRSSPTRYLLNFSILFLLPHIDYLPASHSDPENSALIKGELMIKTSYPNCGFRLTAADDLRDKPVNCQKCGTKFVLSKRWLHEPPGNSGSQLNDARRKPLAERHLSTSNDSQTSHSPANNSSLPESEPPDRHSPPVSPRGARTTGNPLDPTSPDIPVFAIRFQTNLTLTTPTHDIYPSNHFEPFQRPMIPRPTLPNSSTSRIKIKSHRRSRDCSSFGIQTLQPSKSINRQPIWFVMTKQQPY